MNKCQKDILKTTVVWYGIKGIILLLVYVLLIKQILPYVNPGVSYLINIAYAFVCLFVLFSMKGLEINGLVSYKK
ncbi:hypothetical protein HYY69_03800 [Candidatus Woesearchaeota archaeon]|nr:hypothetical protein [Candidatus Woesearchaeota archaeon]